MLKPTEETCLNFFGDFIEFSICKQPTFPSYWYTQIPKNRGKLRTSAYSRFSLDSAFIFIEAETTEATIAITTQDKDIKDTYDIFFKSQNMQIGVIPISTI